VTNIALSLVCHCTLQCCIWPYFVWLLFHVWYSAHTSDLFWFDEYLLDLSFLLIISVYLHFYCDFFVLFLNNLYKLSDEPPWWGAKHVIATVIIFFNQTASHILFRLYHLPLLHTVTWVLWLNNHWDNIVSTYLIYSQATQRASILFAMFLKEELRDSSRIFYKSRVFLLQ